MMRGLVKYGVKKAQQPYQGAGLLLESGVVLLTELMYFKYE